MTSLNLCPRSHQYVDVPGREIASPGRLVDQAGLDIILSAHYTDNGLYHALLFSGKCCPPKWAVCAEISRTWYRGRHHVTPKRLYKLVIQHGEINTIAVAGDYYGGARLPGLSNCSITTKHCLYIIQRAKERREGRGGEGEKEKYIGIDIHLYISIAFQSGFFGE